VSDEHLERERKFDVPADFELPALPGARVQTHLLRATYYDTDDALLQARGVTLRRRVGGPDDGWHLKLPHPEGRLELHTDAGPSRPPRELTALTRGLRFDHPLRRRALLETTRRAHQLLTSEGELVAEIADDHVHATVDPTHEPVRWHEVEVELGPAGTADTMDRLAGLLLARGATPSAHGSKLARAVGERPPRPPLSGLAGLVDGYLQAQYERLALGDLQVRRGENAVHRTRVAVRRTRSTLRTFAPLFDPDRAARLDRELAWYAEALGRVRDLDIVREEVARDAASDPDGLVGAEAATDLLRILDADRRVAWEHLLTVLDGRRYGALLRLLDEWRRKAPLKTASGDTESDVGVDGFVERAQRKYDARLTGATTGPDAPDSAFHRARKAAKRARYAAELALPAMGGAAKRVVAEHEQRQEQLGELQDHVMVLATLREVVARPTTTAQVDFACGVLAQRHARALLRARTRFSAGPDG
jgi:CHAD domain-containing protein